MEQVSIDLFHLGKKNFMVTVDRFSGYLWVDLLRELSTKAVTDALGRITRIFGIPLFCRTDGGPQFRGPFDRYCEAQGITHETSSPYHPQSNGHAEAAVKTAKHLLIKAPGDAFPKALAAWRNTAREDRPSPNEMFMGRKIRDLRPITTTLLNMHDSSADFDTGHHTQPPSRLPTAHEKNSTNLQHQQHFEFKPGDAVRVQDHVTKRWTVPAVVTATSHSGRTCDLQTDEGVIMRRNRRFIRRRCAA